MSIQTINRSILSTVLLLLLMASGLDAAVQVVTAVRIEGNERVDASSIEKTLALDVGDIYSENKVTKSVKDLYRLGLFSRVSIDTETREAGVELVVRVVEFPMVRRIIIEGADAVEESELRKVLQMKAFSFADPGKLGQEVEALKSVYRSAGYHGTSITADVEKGDRGVFIRYRIEESDRTLIHEVDIIGNRFLEDHAIRKVMQTREVGPLSFLSEKGGYSDVVVADDLKRIQLLYMESGFLDISVQQPEVSIHPDGEGLYVSVRLDEGPQYRLGDIRFTGDWEGPPDFARREPEILTGDTFVRSGVLEDLRMYEDSYRDQGYAWCRIEPRFNRDPESATVDLDLNLVRGPLVHIRWIHISGNYKTRDYVIRREMRILEGDLYSQKKLDDSRRFIRGLGFFPNVEVTTTDVGNDQADLYVRVEEGQAGSLTAGAAFSSVSGLVGTLQLSLGNFSGRGQRLNLSAELGGDTSTYSISFTEPRLFSGVFSFGVDLFDRTNDYSEYSQDSVGGGLRLGYRLSDYSSINLRYRYSDYDVYDIDPGASNLIKDQEGKSVTSSLRFGYNYDTRDFPMDPREGMTLQLSTEVAGGGLGGTNDFVRYQAEGSFFHPVAGDLIGLAHIEAGLVSAYGTDEVPVTERYFMGGLYTLRGFAYRKVGPLEDGEPVGGTRSLLVNLETTYPLIRDANIKGVLFLDAGNVWAEDEKVALGDLRYGAGFGFRWAAPVGLLRLEWGFNLDPRPEEEQPGWEFSIGALF